MPTRQRWIGCIGLTGIALLGACAPLEAGVEVPALIVEPTDAGRAELRAAVTELLHGMPATLADDALTRSSVLVLETPEPGNRRDRPATGRTLGAPIQIRLVTDGSACTLVYGDERLTLETVSCVPE